MEEAREIVVDTDVLIEFLDRGNLEIAERLFFLGLDNLRISQVTASELLCGALDKAHRTRLLKFLARVRVVPISPNISQKHFELIEHYSLSHGLQVQDAIIAATALILEAPLYTLNKKDFRFISGLELV